MKTIRIILLLTLGISASKSASTQIRWGNYSQTAKDSVLQTKSAFGLIVNIAKQNNAFWTYKDHSKLFDLASADTQFSRTHAPQPITRTSFDTTKVHFFLQGVNKKNVAEYEYQISEYPGKILKSWCNINTFSSKQVNAYSGKTDLAYLGGYAAAVGKMIIVDVRRRGQNKVLSTAMVAWEPIRPQITYIYTSKNFDAFLRKLQYPWESRANDSYTGLEQPISLPSIDNNVIFMLKADILERDYVQYQLLRNGKIVVPWKKNNYDNSFIWLKNLQPGKYKVEIRYTAQPANVKQYPFTVEPLWYQSSLFKITAIILFAALGGALIFSFLLYRQKKLTRKEVESRTRVQFELQAIHSQLNPHFVFNALSSIQGLVNKQDFKAANIYLSDFSKLMRQSLKSGGRNDLPLEKEIKMLDTYLRLEQLRFGFEYKLEVDISINTTEINIPSLLLQPLIENAVKHGVSNLAGQGKVDVAFRRTGNNLEAEVLDNGGGFDDNMVADGYGLKLTSNRIELINKLNSGQNIMMTINSDSFGTRINLIFNNWFL